MEWDRHILALTDTGLEQFVRDWAAVMTQGYIEVQRFSGAGDMGRDVVGFLTTARHQGPWHNYQCKQYGRNLPTASALLELGKILYFSDLGEFTVPARYSFVAPRGVNRNLERMIFNPSELRDAMIAKWNEYCASKIVDGQVIALTGTLRTMVENFDYGNVFRISVDDILADPAAKPILAKRFGADPGPPPRGIVPSDIESRELPYVSQLIAAYGDREGKTYTGHSEVANHVKYGPHIQNQRERFFEADAFSRFYRDNTFEEELNDLRDEIYHGVIDKHGEAHIDALGRVDAVMSQAAIVQPAGPLARHARVPVKQGICHHLVNDKRMAWHNE